jgi:hypothetical protein
MPNQCPQSHTFLCSIQNSRKNISWGIYRFEAYMEWPMASTALSAPRKSFTATSLFSFFLSVELVKEKSFAGCNSFFCLAELALVQPQQGQYRVNITKERCPQLHIRNPSDQEPH